MTPLYNYLINQIKTVFSPSQQQLEKITLEPCKLKAHGDLTTNVLMILKKDLPANFAETLLENLKRDFPITRAEIVGPGFLNMTFAPHFWQQQLLEERAIPSIGQRQKMMVEFVSTNPTGPLHIGHARNAILGDALSRILKAVGFDVTKEYYINDAGGQVNHLGESLKSRYEETHKGRVLTDMDLKEDMYPGDYLKDIAEKMTSEPENYKTYAVSMMMDGIKESLKQMDIVMDIFTSEQKLTDDGAVNEVFELLKKNGDVVESVLEKPKDFDGPWEERKQWVFKSTKYGDDQDRALTKSDGSWTYFAGDVAYHWDKYRRGFLHMVNVLGADHVGYSKRLIAAVASVSDGQAELRILECQLVKFLKNGEPFKMSKRANTFITMTDVVDEIGADALRFLLLMRRHDMGYDFDLQKAVEKTKDNPVFYVQYATARIGSLMRRFQGSLDGTDVSLLTHESEIDLIKTMTEFSSIVTLAAKNLEPHRVANYCYTLASDFHSLWSQDGYKFLLEDQPTLTASRMKLAYEVGQTLEKALTLLGVSAPKEM